MLTPGETSLLWSLGAATVAAIIDNPRHYIGWRSDGSGGGDYYFNHDWGGNALTGTWSAPADIDQPILYGPDCGDSDQCGGRECWLVHTRYGRVCQPGRHFQRFTPRVELASERITNARLIKWANSIAPALRQAVRDADGFEAMWWAVVAILGPRDWMYRYRDHYQHRPQPLLDDDQYALFEMAS